MRIPEATDIEARAAYEAFGGLELWDEMTEASQDRWREVAEAVRDSLESPNRRLTPADILRMSARVERSKNVPLWVEVQPEYWLNDYAVPSGPSERFDAAPDLLAMDADRLRLLLQEAEQGALGSFDHLYENAARDGRVKAGFGPYDLFVDPNDLSDWMDENRNDLKEPK